MGARSGLLDLSSELGSTALSLAKGPGLDDIKPAIFRSVLDGYVAGRRRALRAVVVTSWFVFTRSVGLVWGTRGGTFSVVVAVEASTGPDLTLSHAVVRNGVRGLPDLYRPPSELEALLV